MRFRNPWIDPRIAHLQPKDVEAYLLSKGWKPSSSSQGLYSLFAAPGKGEENPIAVLPPDVSEGAFVERMVEAVGEIAQFENRFAGDVLSEIFDLAKSHALTNGVGISELAASPV